jgi:hypothetical protein
MSEDIKDIKKDTKDLLKFRWQLMGIAGFLGVCSILVGLAVNLSKFFGGM